MWAMVMTSSEALSLLPLRYLGIAVPGLWEVR
jgi:hypothetical protein